MLPMPDTLTHSQTTEYSATQLVSSIKHKLSHAISIIITITITIVTIISITTKNIFT